MKKTTKKTAKKKTEKKTEKPLSKAGRMGAKIRAQKAIDRAARAQSKRRAPVRQQLNPPPTPKPEEKVAEDVAKLRAANTGPDKPKPEAPAVVEHRQQCISFVWVRNTDLEVGDHVFDPGDQAGSFTNPKFAEVHQVVVDDKTVHVWVSYDRETKRRTWSVDKNNWMPIKYRGGPIDTRTTRYKSASHAYSPGHPSSQGQFQV